MQAVKRIWRQTPAKHEAAYTNLLHGSVENATGEGITEPTDPSHATTEDSDTKVLESFVDNVPNKPGTNHCSAGCCVVRYLGEPSGIDVNPLR